MQFRLNNEKIRKNKAKNFLTKNQKLILADTHDYKKNKRKISKINYLFFDFNCVFYGVFKVCCLIGHLFAFFELF